MFYKPNVYRSDCSFFWHTEPFPVYLPQFLFSLLHRSVCCPHPIKSVVQATTPLKGRAAAAGLKHVGAMTQKGQSDPPALEIPPEAEPSEAQEREPELGHEESGGGEEAGSSPAESPSPDTKAAGTVEDCGEEEGEREDESGGKEEDEGEVMDGGTMEQEGRGEEEEKKEEAEETRCAEPQTEAVDENTHKVDGADTNQPDTHTDDHNVTERLVLSWQRQFRKCQNRITCQTEAQNMI